MSDQRTRDRDRTTADFEPRDPTEPLDPIEPATIYPVDPNVVVVPEDDTDLDNDRNLSEVERDRRKEQRRLQREANEEQRELVKSQREARDKATSKRGRSDDE